MIWAWGFQPEVILIKCLNSWYMLRIRIFLLSCFPVDFRLIVPSPLFWKKHLLACVVDLNIIEKNILQSCIGQRTRETQIGYFILHHMHVIFFSPLGKFIKYWILSFAICYSLVTEDCVALFFLYCAFFFIIFPCSFCFVKQLWFSGSC